jgi:hypothetical protein
MAHVVERLLCKCEVLSSNPPQNKKSLDKREVLETLHCRRWETEDLPKKAN